MTLNAQLSNDEVQQLLDETEEMLNNGTAEIVLQNESMMMIRRADGSGFALLIPDGLIIRFRYMNGPDEAFDPLRMLEISNDRKPNNDADEILKQAFEEK